MWLIHQFDSFLNLGTCKEYPIMAKAKTPRNNSKKTDPVDNKLTTMAESKLAPSPEVRPTETKKYAPPTPINVENEIRRRAYELSEQRGFVPGHENDDWFIAEKEVMARYRQHSA
jgi:hypothetical protein